MVAGPYVGEHIGDDDLRPTVGAAAHGIDVAGEGGAGDRNYAKLEQNVMTA